MYYKLNFPSWLWKSEQQYTSNKLNFKKFVSIWNVISMLNQRYSVERIKWINYIFKVSCECDLNAIKIYTWSSSSSFPLYWSSANKETSTSCVHPLLYKNLNDKLSCEYQFNFAFMNCDFLCEIQLNWNDHEIN